MLEPSTGTETITATGGPKGIFEVLSDICRLKGGFAERNGDGTLQTLLPPEVAIPAGLEEEMRLGLSAGTPGTRYGGYGSDTLAAFGRLLGEEGCFSEFAIRMPHHLKSAGFDKLVQDTLIPSNGLLKFKDAAPAFTPYYLFQMGYAGQADEKRQGMLAFWMNGVTGAAPVEVAPALAWESERMTVEEEVARIPALGLPTLRAAAEAAAARLIEAELDPWRKSLERRRKRDEDRVSAYYRGMAQEIRKRADKKGLTGDDLEKERTRARATEREAERKLEDLRDRYALKVTARPQGCLGVHIPTVHLRCELWRKQARRDITAVYNPFTKRLEPLRCETTHRAVTTFRLEDGSAAIRGL